MINVHLEGASSAYVCSVTATIKTSGDCSILCTIDFSRSSRDALQWAVRLARQLNAHLTILYTYRLIQHRAGEALQLKRDIEASALYQFNLLEREYLNEGELSYEFKVEIGFMADRVEDFARKHTLNFLVTNRNLHANSKESFDELIEHIDVPLLVVP